MALDIMKLLWNGTLVKSSKLLDGSKRDASALADLRVSDSVVPALLKLMYGDGIAVDLDWETTKAYIGDPISLGGRRVNILIQGREDLAPVSICWGVFDMKHLEPAGTGALAL